MEVYQGTSFTDEMRMRYIYIALTQSQYIRLSSPSQSFCPNPSLHQNESLHLKTIHPFLRSIRSFIWLIVFTHRFEPIGYPVSVHLYFYDDRFQGYLVRQEVQNGVTRSREMLEVWAVPKATLQLEHNLHEFERFKHLEVRRTGRSL